jgi:hypothetical protein
MLRLAQLHPLAATQHKVLFLSWSQNNYTTNATTVSITTTTITTTTTTNNNYRRGLQMEGGTVWILDSEWEVDFVWKMMWMMVRVPGGL